VALRAGALDDILSRTFGQRDRLSSSSLRPEVGQSKCRQPGRSCTHHDSAHASSCLGDITAAIRKPFQQATL
jgi:hypothetical protein